MCYRIEEVTEYDCTYPCDNVCTKLSHAKNCQNYRPLGRRVYLSLINSKDIIPV